MGVPLRPSLALVPLLTLVTACGEDDPSGAVGAFVVTFAGEGVSFRVDHPSGLTLVAADDALVFRRADATYEMEVGSFLIEEAPRSDWTAAVRRSDVTKSDGRVSMRVAADDGQALGTLELEARGDNLVVRARAAVSTDNRARLSFVCDDADAMLGFGAMTWDVDHRGERVPIWVSEQGIGKVDTDVPHEVWNLVGTRHQSYLAVPTMLAVDPSSSWGLHATTLYRSIWDLCATDPAVLSVEVWEGTIELVVSPGPTPLDVVAQQTSETGRTPLGPDWTFGVWMERIGGSQALTDEAALLRAEKIPVSAIWSEDFRGATRQGANDWILDEDWRWDEALYPALPDVIDGLHALGIKFQAYANTFVVDGADVRAEAEAGGHLVRDLAGRPVSFTAPSLEPSGLADLFAEGSRAWVRRELEALLALGIDGWMADFAEWYPADRRTVRTSDGSDPEASHHRYPVAWAEVNREAVEASGRDDVVIYHRSGYTGAQRHAHVIWAGDQRTSFQEDDGLPTIIPIIVGLGVAGFPIVTHDIAGYASPTNPPSDEELFFRWTSLGALGPVMRTHHGRSAFANWRWSSNARTIAHFKRWADLHTRLFPLWKGLARDAAATGAPIQRHVALWDPEARALHAAKDVYMIGDALFVAPIVTQGATSRDVTFPRGTWYDFFTPGVSFDGGTTSSVSVPLTEVALFARAGAIVPMLPEGVESLVATDAVVDLGDVRAEREVRVWLGADGRATDADGGAFVLDGAARPSGALASIDGAREILSSEAGHARFTSGASATVTLVDAAGGRHVLRGDGLASDLSITWEVRW